MYLKDCHCESATADEAISRYVIANSEGVKQSHSLMAGDCFVASLLAMTPY